MPSEARSASSGWAPMHLLAQHRSGRRADRLGAFKQPLVVQLDDGRMALGSMSWIRDEATGAALAQVRGDRLAAVEHLDHVPRQAQIHRLADQPVITQRPYNTAPGGCILIDWHARRRPLQA
jgi:hypothetical protein